MPQDLAIHLLPSLFSPDDLQGGIAIIVDVLRATTTITSAIAAGADAVIPCLDIQSARDHKTNAASEQILLGGERHGEKIEGFDLGNSPLHYIPKVVAKKTIAFTTTNGTKALHAALNAETILIGAFVNLNAIVLSLQEELRPIHLICAGTNGSITSEDVLFAGAVVQGLIAQNEANYQLNDSAILAAAAVKLPLKSDAFLLDAIRQSHGGQNLIRLGFDADITFAAIRDLYQIIPNYDKKSGRIVI